MYLLYHVTFFTCNSLAFLMFTNMTNAKRKKVALLLGHVRQYPGYFKRVIFT